MPSIKQKHKKRREAKKRQAAQSRGRVSKSDDPTVVEGAPLTLPNRKTLRAEDVWADVNDALPIESLGAGLKLTKKSTVNFNEALARDLLDPEKYEVFAPDRPFSKEHANRLLRAMQQGTFMWEQLQIMLCSCNGKTFRMNGQHTSWARLYFDNAPHNLPVQMLRYHAETEEDMRMLYASIDRGKARSKGNVIQSYLFGGKQFIGFSKSVLKRLSEGLSFWVWGNNQATHHSGDELAYLMQTDYYDITLKVGHFIKQHCPGGGAGVKHMNRSPVTAALFETFSKNERDSVNFWASVVTGELLSSNDARLKLRNRLQEYAVNAGRGGSTYKTTANGDDMFAWCIQAWNAWRHNRTVRSFKNAVSYKTTPKAE